MIIKTPKNVIHAYNRKKDTLVLLSLDDENDSLCKVKGWFGKKLDELLKNERDFQQVLEEVIFAGQPELTELFQRFILTLMQKHLLQPVAVQELSRLQPLSPTDQQDFGVGDLNGSIVFEEFLNDETLAYAHTTWEGTNYIDHTHCEHGSWSGDSLGHTNHKHPWGTSYATSC